MLTLGPKMSHLPSLEHYFSQKNGLRHFYVFTKP